LNHGLSIRPATDKLGDVSGWVPSPALDEVPLRFYHHAQLRKERLNSRTPDMVRKSLREDRTPLYISDRPTVARNMPRESSVRHTPSALCARFITTTCVCSCGSPARESQWSKAAPTTPRISSWTTPFLPDREVNTHCSA